MITFRRMLPYLLLNIFVSAVVVLSILYWWESNQPALPDTVIEVTAVAQTNNNANPQAVPNTNLPATETPTADDSQQFPIHVVKAGETLGSISTFYEVSIEEIITINNITNPNILSLGQQLIIPVGGIPTATPTATPIPTEPVLPTPIPTETPDNTGEVIMEIVTITNIGILESEAVQIINNGNRPVNLLDWQLSDEDGNAYTFGQVTLYAEGAGLSIRTGAGNDAIYDLYWGLPASVWESGETVTLTDADGATRATYIIP